MRQQAGYIARAAVLYIFVTLFRILPLDIASALGGWLGRSIGRHLKVHGVAKRNLERAMPELSAAQRDSILTEMWDNMGRVAGEYPHLPRQEMSARIEVDERSRKIFQEIKDSGKGAIFVAGHLGNWELAAKTGYDHGIPLALIYRPANNPYADKYIRRIRLSFCSGMYPKGFHGAAQAIKTLRGGGKLGMLVDQKMNDGIAVPFFNREAMTAPATAELALKYNVPIIPARVVRIGNAAKFRFELLPPLEFTTSGDKETDILTIMTAINAQFESWVREHPEQWFWVHKRWKD